MVMAPDILYVLLLAIGRGIMKSIVRYIEDFVEQWFVTEAPLCNPTRPYREGEGRRENLGTRPESQSTLFVRGIFRSVKSSEIRHRSIRPQASLLADSLFSLQSPSSASLPRRNS